MDIKYKAIIGATAVFVSFTIGRYTAPSKVVTKEVIRTVEVKVKDTDIDNNKNTTTTEIVETKPDGTKIDTKTTSNTVDVETAVHTDTVAAKTTSDSKTTIGNSSRISLSLLGGTSLKTPQDPFYGLSLSTSVSGPLNIGIFGLSNGSCGASIGINL